MVSSFSSFFLDSNDTAFSLSINYSMPAEAKMKENNTTGKTKLELHYMLLKTLLTIHISV
jgi:hypothetical protein